MNRLSRIFLPLAAVVPLAACGHGEGYPSLARRPAELIGADGKIAAPTCPDCKRDGEPAPCPTPATPPARVTGAAPVVTGSPVGLAPEPPASASLPAQLAALTGGARADHARFEGKRAAAERAVGAAAGAAAGSDAWARATLLLSDLDATHAGVSGALANLDRLAVADRLAHAEDDPDGSANRPEAAAIRDAVAAVAALVDAENAALDALKARMAR